MRRLDRDVLEKLPRMKMELIFEVLKLQLALAMVTFERGRVLTREQEQEGERDLTVRRAVLQHEIKQGR